MMQGQFAMLSFKCNIYCVQECTRTLDISLDSQGKKESYNINSIIEDKRASEFQARELIMKKHIFNLHFFNQDISLKIKNVDIGPSFSLIKCSKNHKNIGGGGGGQGSSDHIIGFV